MAYEPGKNSVQYRCKFCRTVSPHDNKCFVCGRTDKIKESVPLIIAARKKGSGINIKVG